MLDKEMGRGLPTPQLGHPSTSLCLSFLTVNGLLERQPEACGHGDKMAVSSSQDSGLTSGHQARAPWAQLPVPISPIQSTCGKCWFEPLDRPCPRGLSSGAWYWPVWLTHIPRP